MKVPNPIPGKSTLKWQFCTEYYDIGFGLDFEVANEGSQDFPELKTVLPIMRIQADSDVSIGSHVEVRRDFWLLFRGLGRFNF